MKSLYQKNPQTILKMSVVPKNSNNEIEYRWNNEFLIEKGHHIQLTKLNEYECLSCKKIIPKYFGGYCYVCNLKKASADFCMLDPSLCHYSKGTCREPQWADNFCFSPHYVYLAFTDKFKVGITRKNQIPTRWCDQGATMAAILCQVNSRYLSGLLEKKLTKILADKSHWINMLKMGNCRPTQKDFSEKFYEVQNYLNEIQKEFQFDKVFFPEHLKNLNQNLPFQQYLEPEIYELNYQMPNEMNKIKSKNLSKHDVIEGEIIGMKGQYLFIDDFVTNIRSHEGYRVSVNFWRQKIDPVL